MIGAAARLLLPSLVLVVLVTTNARADERPVVTANVKVDAPAACANADSFTRAVARRTDRVQIGANAGADVMLEVAVRSDERGATGDVRMRRGGRALARRSVSGASCEEVTQALSLVVALAFDPAARTDVPKEEAEAPASAPAAVPASASVPEPAVGAPASAPTREEPTPARRPNDEPRWRFGIGAHASVIGAAAPDATAGFGGFLDLERDSAGFSPSFRAGVVRSNGETSANGVTAEITWTVARASVCPVRFDLASTVAVRPCIGVDAGAMAASASAVDRAQNRSRPWVAGAAAIRLAWSPVRSAFIEAEGGAAVPFVRDELAVDPTVSLYKTPSVVPAAQIAAGVRFP